MTLELIEAAGLLGFDAARGWPATFTHDKTARLQSWRKGMERKAHRLEATTWTKLIRLALASELAHQTTTKLVQNDDHLFAPIPFFASDEWYSRDFDDGQTRQVNARAPSRTETHHHITAPDFAAWLATQDMEPSPHIAAWFKAQGVGNTAPKATPAPVPTQESPLAKAALPCILKKSAMLVKFRVEWPTIEADINEAARNGLAVAKTGKKGMWYADKAIEWARSRGKWLEPVRSHQIDAAWHGDSKKHTIGK